MKTVYVGGLLYVHMYILLVGGGPGNVCIPRPWSKLEDVVSGRAGILLAIHSLAVGPQPFVSLGSGAGRVMYRGRY